jgi:hypothetical protein
LRNIIVFLDSTLDGEKTYNIYQIQIVPEKFRAPEIGQYKEMLILCHRIILKNFISISIAVIFWKNFHYERKSRLFNRYVSYIETPI